MNEQALKDRIQAISKETGIHFNECWKKLLFERFFEEIGIKQLQKLWNSHLKNLGNLMEDLRFPEKITDVIQEINFYLSENVIS